MIKSIELFAGTSGQSKQFSFNEKSITFAIVDTITGEKTTMVNATEMGKVFGKRPVDWLQNQNTKDFIRELSKVRNSTLADLVRVIRGGNNAGTWMHEDVAMEYARWLSPQFGIWCNDRIKELMQHGFTATDATIEQLVGNPDLVISLAIKLKEERTQKAAIQRRLEEKKTQLDESKEWWSIKRWAKVMHKDWRKVSWRKLKALSYELGYEVKKIFDANYGQVNVYHINVFNVYSQQ